MYFFKYFLLVLSFTFINGLLQLKNCPTSCICSSTENVERKIKIRCYTGFWRRIPDIPEHTTELYVRDSDMGVLQGPPKCVNYDKLVTLRITRNKITAISNSAFRCFSNLTKLNIGENRLRKVIPSAMTQLQSLWSLTMDNNQLTSRIINTVCQLKSIVNINLSQNELILNEGTLDCMTNLKHLDIVQLSGNYFNGSFRDIIWPLRNATSVEANSCHIKNITEDTLNGFNIKTISLQSNYIEKIQNNTFAGAHLNTLNLGNNPLNGSYKWINTLPEIKVLVIRNISLSEVPPLPRSIKSVDLNYNRIKTLTYHSFCNLPKLEVISIESAHIHEIETMSLCKLPKLNTLNIYFNHIQGRHLMNLLSSLSNSSVQHLSLSTNPIKSLDKTTFGSFHPNVLKTLLMKSCLIENIGSETFSSLRSLEKLDLSSNKLQKIERNTFSGLHSLIRLCLESNHLFDFKGEVNGIRGSPLKFLNLMKNGIRSFISATLWGLQDVDYLILRKNDITSVKQELFQNMSSLSKLDMSECRISNIQEGSFSSLLDLKELHLYNNPLTLKHLRPSNFKYLTKLKQLDLSDTLVGNSGGGQLHTIWQNTLNLTLLNLSTCRIPKLFPGMFSMLRHLKQLYLNNNLISFIEPMAFKNTSDLEELFINKNQINSVSWMSFVNLPNLKTLSLQGNSLVCTCDVLWLAQAIRSQQIYIPQQDKLYCTDPGQRKQRMIVTVVNVLYCEESWVTMLKPIGIAFAGVSLVIIMYLLQHYQWHIRYTFFLAKAGINRYREMKDEEQYKYDAFVAYHSDDLPWVEHLFLHNVDKEYLNDKGFTLCIHHRDWLVGEYISDNIRKSVIESRKTIIILSKAFATSHWCRFELEMARANIDPGGRGDSRIVVILLESIPEELLNPHLVHILTKKTYITWPKDPALHPRFWKAVRKTLKKEYLYNI